MKIERIGDTLTVLLGSGIGYSVRFDAKQHSEHDAEAWRVHLQNEQDRLDSNTISNIRHEHELVIRLERRVAGLRGYIARLKKEGGKAT